MKFEKIRRTVGVNFFVIFDFVCELGVFTGEGVGLVGEGVDDLKVDDGLVLIVNPFDFCSTDVVGLVGEVVVTETCVGVEITGLFFGILFNDVFIGDL